MNDEEFINYFDRHSRTERALFSGDDVNRLLDLAGSYIHKNYKGRWVTFRYEVAKYFIADARQKIIKEKRFKNLLI